MTVIDLHSHSRQQGTVLVITLLILVIMTLIVLSGSRNTTLQLRMASNLQTRIDALQKVQSAIDDVIVNYNATDFQDDDLFICTENGNNHLAADETRTCDPFKSNSEYLKLSSTSLYASSATDISWVLVDRVKENIDLTGFTIKAGFKGAGGGNWFGTGYEITSGYDGSETGQGKAVIKIGAIKLSRQ